MSVAEEYETDPTCCPWCGESNIFVNRSSAQEGGVFTEYDMEHNPLRTGKTVRVEAEIECFTCRTTTELKYEVEVEVENVEQADGEG